MAGEGYSPTGPKPQIEKSDIPSQRAELLTLTGGADTAPLEAAIAVLKQEVLDAPIVGRSLAAIKGKEFIIPVTSTEQKERVLSALYDLSIFPWEENGVLIVDHHRDMRKLQLADLTNQAPVIPPIEALPENNAQLTFPLERHDSLSEHMKTLYEERTNVPNEQRIPRPMRKTVDESSAEEEIGIDTELKKIINRFDQGLIDDSDEEFQRRIGVFPTLTLFPRQYIWQNGNPIEKSTGEVISRDQRNELYALAKDGDAKAITKLVRMHTGLVLEAVMRVKEKFGGDADDLFQEGMTGLVRALEMYEPEGGASFSTYAMYWIENRTRRFSYTKRYPIHRPVHLQQRQRQYRKASEKDDIHELPSTERSEFVQNDISISAGRDRLERLYFLNAAFDPISDDESNVLDARYAEDSFAKDMIDKDIPPEVFQHELEEKVKAMLLTLTPREERIIRLRFGINTDSELEEGQLGTPISWTPADLTLDEVGEQFSISGNRIRQIEAKALRKLKHPARSRNLRPLMDMMESQSWQAYYGYDWRKGREREEKRIKTLQDIETMKKTRLPEA